MALAAGLDRAALPLCGQPPVLPVDRDPVDVRHSDDRRDGAGVTLFLLVAAMSFRSLSQAYSQFPVVALGGFGS